jgi:hypothetical protein
MILRHKFVENIPRKIENGVLYISIEHCTAIHKCVCGCGNEVVTPFSPTGWKMTFDGKTISLSPSIGNWNYNCKSHYWIKNSSVVWSTIWSDKKIKKDKKKFLFWKK